MVEKTESVLCDWNLNQNTLAQIETMFYNNNHTITSKIALLIG